MRVHELAVLGLLAAAAACGGGGGEPKKAEAPTLPQRLRYSCAQDKVFAAVVETVRADAPPLGESDKASGIVTTGLTWYDGRGTKKPAGQPIAKDDRGVILELAVVTSGDAREVRGVVRVFEPGPEAGGREMDRARVGWPSWSTGKLDDFLRALHGRLAACAVKPDE